MCDRSDEIQYISDVNGRYGMILGLRLFMTPLLIATVTLIGRRWGPGVSGWLIGFPLTSGPVSLILALQYGSGFAAQAAVGILGGLISICAFNLAYSVVSRRGNWLISATAAAVAFLVVTAIQNSVSLALLPTFALALIAIGSALRLIPKHALPMGAAQVSRWDLPARMIVATTFVLALTGLAPLLGPQLSGLITPFPVFGTVLAAFAHHQQGAAAARNLLRGMTVSLLGVTGFMLAVGGLLTSLGIGWTYALAVVVVIVVNGLAFRMIR